MSKTTATKPLSKGRYRPGSGAALKKNIHKEKPNSSKSQLNRKKLAKPAQESGELVERTDAPTKPPKKFVESQADLLNLITGIADQSEMKLRAKVTRVRAFESRKQATTRALKEKQALKSSKLDEAKKTVQNQTKKLVAAKKKAEEPTRRRVSFA